MSYRGGRGMVGWWDRGIVGLTFVQLGPGAMVDPNPIAVKSVQALFSFQQPYQQPQQVVTTGQAVTVRRNSNSGSVCVTDCFNVLQSMSYRFPTPCLVRGALIF
eukprot:3425993-Pyramimonas_sp.AAC.2